MGVFTGAETEPGSACPDRKTLTDFDLGKLPADVSTAVETHLSTCQRCEEIVYGLQTENAFDTLIARLRKSPADTLPATGPGGDDVRTLDWDDAQTLDAGDNPKGRPGSPSELAFTIAGPAARMVGRYQLGPQIGAGGMGVVYRAWQSSPRRNVAVKMILAGHHAGRQTLDRFVREGDAIARLQHANVVQVYEAGEHEGLPFFSMELVEGGTLSAKLAADPLDPREAAALVRTLALAVDYAHRMGVVHRDLKPGNILLTTDGTPKITDFGLAKFLDEEREGLSPGRLTESGMILGTPNYMSPEQASGLPDVGASTDVYALGAILYETLTGRPPFTGDNRLRTLEMVRTVVPVAPSGVRKGVPGWLEAICLKCLEKAPAHRYATARDLADDLGRWLNDERPRGLPGRLTRVRRALRRRPRRERAAALVVLALAAAGAFAYLARPDLVRQRNDAALARGRAVTLIGPVGPPGWSRWRFGAAEGQTGLAADGTFAVGSWKLSLLELAPDTRSDRYRVSAQVRHETSETSGEVGLYVSRKEVFPERFDVDLFGQLTFNGVRGDADLRARLPAYLVPPEPRTVASLPMDNVVTLKAHLVAVGPRGPRIDWVPIKVSGPRFKPRGEGNGIWHDLELIVTPETVSARWDGRPFETTVAYLQQGIADEIDFPHRGDSFPPGFVPKFDARGGVGIYVERGLASFRAVTVTPLRKQE